MIVKTMTAEQIPGGRGAARVPGWIDGKTTAVIRFAGFPAGDSLDSLPFRVRREGREFVRRYGNIREAMNGYSSVALYSNLVLISAVLWIQPEPPEPWELEDPALD